MKRLLAALFVAAFAGAACGGGDPPSKKAATVSSINPNSGPASGGTPVTITGSDFASGATVTVGGIALTGVTVNGGSITGTTGASATAGPVSVNVTNPEAPAGTLQNGYTYLPVLVARITGAPSTIQHDTPTTFSGATSTTTSPYSITQYSWNCGQDTAVYGSGCDVANNPTPSFSFRKCGVSGRPACTSGTQRTYTVTLTVTDSSGRQNVTTFQVTVTNKY
jgi:hypothetical protein